MFFDYGSISINWWGLHSFESLNSRVLSKHVLQKNRLNIESNPTDSNMDPNQAGSNTDPNEASSSSGDQLTHLEGVSRSLSLGINRLPLRQSQSTTRIDAGQRPSHRQANRHGGRYNMPPHIPYIDPTTTGDSIGNYLETSQTANNDAPTTTGYAVASSSSILQTGVDKNLTTTAAATVTPRPPNPLPPNAPQTNQIQATQGPAIQTPANALPADQIPANRTVFDRLKAKLYADFNKGNPMKIFHHQ
jgi:hypothetical protein